MLGRTHTTINAASWLTAITAVQLATDRPLTTPTIVGTALTIATSRLPDVDHPKSSCGYRVNRLLPGLPTWLEQKFGARKSPMHWGGVAIVCGLLVSTVASLASPSLWWLGAATGGSWLLHIAGDCLTWQGAPLLAPVSPRMVRPRYGRRFRCGGRFERRFVLPAASAWCTVSALLVSANIYRAFL